MTSPILIVVQARMESARLPGKVLLPLCGQPMLFWLLSRLSTLPYPLVVAVPDTLQNATLVGVVERHGYTPHIISGDPDDVLGRFAKVAMLYPDAEHIVRIGGDTPLLDPAVIAELIALHLRGHDYTGLSAEWGDGLADSEVFTRHALLEAHEQAEAPHEREHVSPYIFTCPQTYQLAHLPCPFDLSHMRVSVDTKEDFFYVQMLLERCLLKYGFGFGWREVWWLTQQDAMLQEYMAKRPMNGAYVEQVGGGKSWDELRYQGGHTT